MRTLIKSHTALMEDKLRFKFPLSFCQQKHSQARSPLPKGGIEQGVKYRKMQSGAFGRHCVFSPKPTSRSHAKNKPEEVQLYWV